MISSIIIDMIIISSSSSSSSTQRSRYGPVGETHTFNIDIKKDLVKHRVFQQPMCHKTHKSINANKL